MLPRWDQRCEWCINQFLAQFRTIMGRILFVEMLVQIKYCFIDCQLPFPFRKIANYLFHLGIESGWRSFPAPRLFYFLSYFRCLFYTDRYTIQYNYEAPKVSFEKSLSGDRLHYGTPCPILSRSQKVRLEHNVCLSSADNSGRLEITLWMKSLFVSFCNFRFFFFTSHFLHCLTRGNFWTLWPKIYNTILKFKSVWL